MCTLIAEADVGHFPRTIRWTVVTNGSGRYTRMARPADLCWIRCRFLVSAEFCQVERFPTLLRTTWSAFSIFKPGFNLEINTMCRTFENHMFLLVWQCYEIIGKGQWLTFKFDLGFITPLYKFVLRPLIVDRHWLNSMKTIPEDWQAQLEGN